MSRLVEPTSVTTVSGPQASSAAVASSARPATGAAQKTTSAPSQACGAEVAALPIGQPDRAADQADAEDGDPHSPRRALVAEAS